jgi:hypothetical protein
VLGTVAQLVEDRESPAETEYHQSHAYSTPVLLVRTKSKDGG